MNYFNFLALKSHYLLPMVNDRLYRKGRVYFKHEAVLYYVLLLENDQVLLGTKTSKKVFPIKHLVQLGLFDNIVDKILYV